MAMEDAAVWPARGLAIKGRCSGLKPEADFAFPALSRQMREKATLEIVAIGLAARAGGLGDADPHFVQGSGRAGPIEATPRDLARPRLNASAVRREQSVL